MNGIRKPTLQKVSVWKPALLGAVCALLFLVAVLFGFIYYVKNFYKPAVDKEPPPFETPPVTLPGGNPSPSGPEIYNRSEDCYNFLVVGKDKVALNTDVIMLVHYDVPTGKMNILQIPRDTYVMFDGYGRRINSLYARLWVREYEKGNATPNVEGVAAFAKIVESGLNVRIDYTFLVDLDAFGEIVDAIGGVDVDVAADMDYEDPDQDLYIHIKKGFQTLRGKDAEGFIRFRSGYVTADIGRIDAQKIFITAMIKKIKENFTINTVGEIAKIAINKVQTTMSLTDATYFATHAISIDMASVNFLTMPGSDIQSENGAWYYVIHRADALYVINNYFNVFDKPVPETSFDSGCLFGNDSDAEISDIYRAELSEDLNVRSAEDVDKNSIYIPRLSH